MKIIYRLFVILLVCMVTIGVKAQTSTLKNVLKLSESDIAKIEYALKKNKNLWSGDSLMIAKLLKQDNTPIAGVVTEEEEYVTQALENDNWTAFLSYEDGSYWLNYVVKRKNKFVGSLNIRLD